MLPLFLLMLTYLCLELMHPLCLTASRILVTNDDVLLPRHVAYQLASERYAMPKDPRTLAQIIAQGKKANNLNVIHAAAFVVSQSAVTRPDDEAVLRIKAVLRQLAERSRERMRGVRQ